jgi:hypothetical protein
VKLLTVSLLVLIDATLECTSIVELSLQRERLGAYREGVRGALDRLYSIIRTGGGGVRVSGVGGEQGGVGEDPMAESVCLKLCRLGGILRPEE